MEGVVADLFSTCGPLDFRTSWWLPDGGVEHPHTGFSNDFRTICEKMQEKVWDWVWSAGIGRPRPASATPPRSGLALGRPMAGTPPRTSSTSGIVDLGPLSTSMEN